MTDVALRQQIAVDRSWEAHCRDKGLVEEADGYARKAQKLEQELASRLKEGARP